MAATLLHACAFLSMKCYKICIPCAYLSAYHVITALRAVVVLASELGRCRDCAKSAQFAAHCAVLWHVYVVEVLISSVVCREVATLNKSVSALSFSDELEGQTVNNGGYVFNAGTDLLAPSKLQSCSGASRSTNSKNGTEDSRDNSTVGGRSFEAPDPTIAAAFLAKASTSGMSDYSIPDVLAGPHVPGPTVIAAPGFEVLLPDSAVLEHFSQDLIPYYLCQYELEGIAVTAHPIPADLPQEAHKAAKSTAIGAIPEFESLAIAVMQHARPSLAGLDVKDVKLEMRSMAEVLKLACEARMTDGRSEVPLAELMYDDAFVHGLVVCTSSLPVLLCTCTRTGPVGRNDMYANWTWRTAFGTEVRICYRTFSSSQASSCWTC